MEEIQHHERIFITPASNDPKRVQLRFETNSFFPLSGLQSSFKTPTNEALISVMKDFQLASLSISISDSSDQNISQSQIRERNIQMSLESSYKSYSFESFPVGSTLTYKTIDPMHSINQVDLMRRLSQKHLLGKMFPIQEQLDVELAVEKSEPVSDFQGRRRIFIPQYAYTLCHTQDLLNILAMGSPCRNQAGIWNKFPVDLLNEDSIQKKTAWMYIERDFETGLSITQGVRFLKFLDWSKEKFSLADILSYEDYDEDSEEEEEYEEDEEDWEDKSEHYEKESAEKVFLEACPLMDSSKIVITRNDPIAEFQGVFNEIDGDTFDFQSGLLEMTNDIIAFAQQEFASTPSKLGLQRTVSRTKGPSNEGTFLTRIYSDGSFDVESDRGMSCDQRSQSGVNVTIYNDFPAIMKPILHSLRVFSVQGKGAGEENFALSSNALVTGAAGSTHGAMEPLLIQELFLHDLMNHNLHLDLDGSARLSFTTDLQFDSSVFIIIDYKPRFFEFERFPSDPNRGIDVPPSYATFVIQNPCLPTGHFQTKVDVMTVYSNALLVMPPVPDMSMPFNVIAIASTVIAIFVGTSMRFITNKASESVSNRYKGIAEKSKGQRIVSKVKVKLNFLKDGLSRLKAGLSSRGFSLDNDTTIKQSKEPSE